MDEPRDSLPASPLSVVLARIAAQAGLLAGIFGVFAALVLFGELGPVAALLGFLVIMAGGPLLPAGTVTVTRTVELPRAPGADADDAVFAFADALADPCLVLDRRSVVVH